MICSLVSPKTPARPTPAGADLDSPPVSAPVSSTPISLPPRTVAAGGITAGVGLLAALVFPFLGQNPAGLAGGVTVIANLFFAGWPVAAYLAAGVGWGRLLRPLLRESEEAWTLQAAGGIALLLTLTHALAALGLLGAGVAWGVVLAGLAVLAHQLVFGGRSAEPVPPRLGPDRLTLAMIACAALPVALTLVAASTPPGWLWDSEFGGYDVLSYHLMLPQEWLQEGRLRPLGHNVYSWLPSYLEAAFLHLALLLSAPARPGGLAAGGGEALLAAQYLHAAFGVLTGIFTARLVRRLLLDRDTSPVWADRAGAAAALFVLATPWTVVVGSMAYNELGVTALAAAALLACVDARLGPARRGALAALLVGIACGVKPTALLFVAPPAALLLAGTVPPRRWWRVALAGVLVGLLTLAPWLVRNAVHGGNPVFPQLTDLFGTAHWAPEAVERYRGAHSFDGTTLDRLRLLFASDPGARPGAPDVERLRGFANPQWAAFLPAVLAALGVCSAFARVRWAAVLLGAGLAAQLLAWLFLTHLQSRFLVPALPVGAVLLGLAIAAPGGAKARTGVLVLALGASAVQVGVSVVNFAGQRGGQPTSALVQGLPILRGDTMPDDPHGRATPMSFLNATLIGPGDRVLLIGDAAPLYYQADVAYATAYDPSPLSDAMAAGDDPADWARALAGAGYTHALIDFGEVARLHRSGFSDPRLSPEAAAALAGVLDPIAAWDGGRVAVFRIPNAGEQQDRR